MKKKILIADDSPLVHRICENLLKKEGHEVVHAENGVAAINQAFNEMPDLILLDVNMPKINGYQVCRLLKDHPATKHIPIIIQTSPDSYSSVSDPQNWSFQTGADGYIDKGEIDHLIQILTPFLEKPSITSSNHPVQKPMSEMEIMTSLSKLLDKQLYLDVTHLKELDERKNAFVANVSHEFRSPLTAIGGYLELLKMDMCGPLTPKQREITERSLKTVQRLVRLVSDLLDLAKIEAGKMELKKEKVDLSSLLDEVIETYQVSADEKKIKIKKEINQRPLEIIGDKDRLTQVIINLLYNSIKFIQEEGSITLRLFDKDSQIMLEIEDNGPGINQENLKKIFDKFERVTAEKKEGTGLGLPISQDIVKLHGGSISVESEEGKGSKFIVTLPKS